MFRKEKIAFERFSLRRRFNASQVDFRKEVLLEVSISCATCLTSSHIIFIDSIKLSENSP